MEQAILWLRRWKSSAREANQAFGAPDVDSYWHILHDDYKAPIKALYCKPKSLSVMRITGLIMWVINSVTTSKSLSHWSKFYGFGVVYL